MALADRSDDFSAPTLDPKWRTFNATAAWSLEYGPGGAGGYLDLVVTQGAAPGMFWFEANDGQLAYPEDDVSGDAYISGDFEVEVEVELLSSDGSPFVVANFPRIAGVSMQVLPDPTTANPGVDQYTYAHAGLGEAPAAQAGSGPHWEWKFTELNATTWNTIGRRGSRGFMRLRRVGSYVEIATREPDQTEWMVLYSGTHPLLSRPVAVGLMGYSSQPGANLRLRCHSITFTEIGNLMFTETGSQRALNGTFPTTLQFGFSTTTPVRAEGGNGNNATDPVGGNYSRTSITYDAANADGEMVVQGPVALPSPSAAWNQTHACWWDPLDGALLVSTPYATVLQVGNNPSIADEAMVLRIV